MTFDPVQHAKDSIEDAAARRSKINAGVLAVHGMSSPQVRHLLNNLCNREGCNYLEVGAWQGSTVISAAFGNAGHFTAIDSCEAWLERPFPLQALLDNQERFRGTAPFALHEIDAWQFDISLLPPGVNVYFYDGDHSPEATAKALTHFHDALAETFVLVMDDWNREGIRVATLAAIAGSYHTLYGRELFTPGRESGTHRHPISWWNGLYVAVLQKADAAERRA